MHELIIHTFFIFIRNMMHYSQVYFNSPNISCNYFFLLFSWMSRASLLFKLCYVGSTPKCYWFPLCGHKVKISCAQNSSEKRKWTKQSFQTPFKHAFTVQDFQCFMLEWAYQRNNFVVRYVCMCKSVMRASLSVFVPFCSLCTLSSNSNAKVTIWK